MPATPPPAPAWMEHAACAAHPTDYWFADGTADWRTKHPNITRRAATAEAQRICGDCPVRTECLDHAIEHHLRHGIYGGCTPADRDLIAATRRRR